MLCVAARGAPVVGVKIQRAKFLARKMSKTTFRAPGYLLSHLKISIGAPVFVRSSLLSPYFRASVNAECASSLAGSAKERERVRERERENRVTEGETGTARKRARALKGTYAGKSEDAPF